MKVKHPIESLLNPDGVQLALDRRVDQAKNVTVHPDHYLPGEPCLIASLKTEQGILMRYLIDT